MQRLIVLVSALSLSFVGVTATSAQNNRGERQPIRFDPNANMGQLGGANQWRNWRRNNQIKFQQSLRAANPAQADKDELSLAAKVYTDRLTDPAERDDLPNVADELLNRVNTFATPKTKDWILEQLTARLSDLLRHEDLAVRINAATFLGRLDEKAAGLAGGGGPAIPYWQVYLPLLDVIEDPNQATAVQFAAAKSLERVVSSKALPRQQRDDVIFRVDKVLAAAADPNNWPKEATKAASYWVYIKQLAEVMGDVGVARTLTVQPIPVNSLLAIAIDQRQHWWTRATAFHGISKLGLDSDPAFNVGLFAQIGAHLIAEAVDDFAQDPNDSHWRWTFTLLYLSFRPLNQELANRGIGWESLGSMAKFRQSKDIVNDAFAAILPTITEVLGANPVAPVQPSNAAVEKLNTFVTDNPVEGQKPHPRSPAVKFTPKPGAADADPNAASGNPDDQVAERPSAPGT